MYDGKEQLYRVSKGPYLTEAECLASLFLGRKITIRYKSWIEIRPFGPPIINTVSYFDENHICSPIILLLVSNNYTKPIGKQ